MSQDSQKVLCKLRNDFQVLQVEENVEKIFHESMSFIKKQDARGSLLRVLMVEVKGKILEQFNETLRHFKNKLK